MVDGLPGHGPSGICHGESLLGFCVVLLPQELATSLEIMVLPEKRLLSGHSHLVLRQGTSSYGTSGLMYLACPGLMFIFISDK